MLKNSSSSKNNHKSKQIRVGILLGSASDYPVIEEGEKILSALGISFETTVASAHRTPDLVREFIQTSEERGVQVFIAAAGGAAALPGVVAAESLKPVIGVPITSPLSGLDSLLSIAQMPGGIPVAAVAIGKAGAKNAALLAAEIIALSDSHVADALQKQRQDQRNKVIEDAKKLKSHAAS